MSAWPNSAASAPVLTGAEGELVSIRISIDPRLLEQTLDALAYVPFPINPEIQHGWPTAIEFPAYRSRLPELRSVLASRGIPTRHVQVSRMLDAILA